ncbi:GNAT family N-acetyltransferase [Pyruvatibacter mobilis]|uniref:GNAT family N-acetyltransferase n=1 Tax=Pyruvatibacter mobilis TaxID=1712261 RepID=UPI003D0C9D19
MTDHVIHRAGPGDDKRVGRIIGEAFADDPISLWILQKPALITRMMTRLARAAYIPAGFSEFLDNEQGATMWMPPGGSKAMSFGEQLGAMKDMLLTGVPGALSRSTAFEKALKPVKPKEPHFYLFTIGVVPEGQGKGLGGALLRSGLEQVDRASMPAFLESSKPENIPIYQRYGFELTEEPDLPEGCPPIYPMWREARRGGGA